MEYKALRVCDKCYQLHYSWFTANLREMCMCRYWKC
uniref:Hyperglycemic hormone-like peptide n=1 Tax=Myoviridae sp. ct4QN2 TaxID=2825030 RepID=A0A8S5PUF2_9CAUD|nr:MAG TPA: hyperglycemic hormone-like peptide [Myoviridae sp. ct4QN2]